MILSNPMYFVSASSSLTLRQTTHLSWVFPRLQPKIQRYFDLCFSHRWQKIFMACFTLDTLFIVRPFSTRLATSLTSSRFCMLEQIYLVHLSEHTPLRYYCYEHASFSLCIRITEALKKADDTLKISDAIFDVKKYTNLTGQLTWIEL